MMPSRSPSSTSSETPPTAVSPPKRFVTDSSASKALPPGGARAPDEEGPDEPLGHEADHDDEEAAVDDQVDADQARGDVRERGAQVVLERGDQDRAEEGAERGAGAADDRV